MKRCDVLWLIVTMPFAIVTTLIIGGIGIRVMIEGDSVQATLGSILVGLALVATIFVSTTILDLLKGPKK